MVFIETKSGPMYVSIVDFVAIKLSSCLYKVHGEKSIWGGGGGGRLEVQFSHF